MKLIDAFPDALTGSGIFDALDNYNVPWKTDISSISLDLEYFGNISGDKTVSPLVRKLSVNGVLSSNAITKIAQSLYNMHGLRWSKLWNTYQLEYDPIQNYNMTEIMSDDDTVTTYGRTHSKTGTEIDDRTRTDDNTESIYGFNSSTASDSDESDRTINDDNTHTYNVSDTDTGSDRQSHSYELTRSGNIGVTTSQQMIESERTLWMWRYFYDVVFPDVDKMLTIAIYSCDLISESGGATPTGTINITSNGDYDVTEYANAAVNVPNTYSESDNGMVVYNGELVSQIGREISENGTYDTTLNNAVMVNVPNTFTAADEGKVVNNGVLTAQGSQTITENGVYDTTLISELTANVSGVTIIGGTTYPTSVEGSDGDIYIKYTDYSGSSIPEGYTELEFIGVGDTGGAYIDTLFNFTTNSEFEIKAQYTAQPNNNSWLFGAYNSGKQTNVGCTSGYIYIQTGGNNKSIVFDTDEHIYKSTHSEFIIDGVVQTGSTPNWANTTTLSVKLFYIGDGSYSNKCRIYYCKVWDSDALVRNLVPVKRNSDNAFGMYDLVNDIFYTNIGAGSFIAGEEISGQPIDSVYLKVNGIWKIIEDCDWSDINI